MVPPPYGEDTEAAVDEAEGVWDCDAADDDEDDSAEADWSSVEAAARGPGVVPVTASSPPDAAVWAENVAPLPIPIDIPLWINEPGTGPAVDVPMPTVWAAAAAACCCCC